MSAPHPASHAAPAAPYAPAAFVPAPRVPGPPGAPVAPVAWAPPPLPPLPPPLPPPHAVEPPAGLADVRELGEPWASSAAAVAGAIAMGAVGNAYTPSAMGYPPPASYRVPAPHAAVPVPHPAGGPQPVPQPFVPAPHPAPTPGPVDARVPAPRNAPRTPLRPTLPAVALT